MLTNYFKTAWRSLRKDKRSTLLNLVGLSTGLACAIIIFMWVMDELKTDKFFKNDSRLYQVMENRVQADGIWTAPSTSGLMADAMIKDFPEVEYTTNIVPATNVSIWINKENAIRADGKYAGKDFFKVFSYDVINGSTDKALTDKSSIVLSDDLAKKLFGTTNVINKTVSFQDNQQYRISGIFKKPGIHASDQFDFVLPVAVFADANQFYKEWGNTFNSTYLLLKPITDIAQFNHKIANYVKQKTNNQITYRTPFVVRYSDIYLHGHYENGIQSGGRIDYVHLFSIIAIFILLIACINFMNLSTAKASVRAKEVGIRKVIGANRQTLILQYFGESILTAFASLLIACLLVFISLPTFNNITAKHLNLFHTDTNLIFSIFAITLLTGFLSGMYPALYLSGFKPALVLKGKLINGISELLVRKALVVFQFTLSIILIVGVLVVYNQIRFIQTKNLGYNRDHIITFNKEGKLAEGAGQETFLAEVRKIPGVIQASSIGHHLTGHDNGTNGVDWAGKDPNDKTEFENVPVDYGMLQTLGISLKEGRDFSPAFSSDTSKIIFNEVAIEYMGMKDPIGKTVKLWDQQMQIVGVVKDFNFQSLHEKIKPLFIRLSPNSTYRFMAKIQAGKETAAIEKLQQLYKQFNPDFSFEYTFLDSNYQAMYAAENIISVLSKYFAVMAILISCLGLFGLAAFTAEKRRKEIGIRKVIGASITNITIMLSGEFLKLVLFALLLAFPLAWWALSKWLQSFAYRASINWWVFVITGFTAIAIALLTVMFQAIKAGIANPVRSLRTE